MEDRISLNRKRLILFGVFAVLAFGMLYLAPYTRDDWAWGSSIGMERLSEFFKDYNGRYGGNTVEIILTRFRWLRALIETAVLCGLIYFMAPKGSNRTFFYVLGMSMIILEPVAMMRQTLVYTAGFTNYVIPTLSMMFFIRYFEPLLYAHRVEDIKFKVIHSVPLALLAFISCVFMEHITLYLLCLSTVIVLYSFIKFRKIFAAELGFLIGSLAGSILMFSNGAYWNVLSGSDKYRSLGNGTAHETVNPYIQDISHTLYAQNWFFNILLCLTVLIIMNKCRDRQGSKVIFVAGYVSGAALLVLTATSWIVFLTGKLTGVFNSIPMIAIYPILLCICFVTLIAAVRGKYGKFLIFISVSIVIVNLPLIIVNPVSPRCFFPAFILMCVFVMECLKYVRLNKSFIYIASTVLLMSFIGMFIIYIPLYKADMERVTYIRNQVASGETEIVIDNLPNEEFVWGVTPKSDTKWERRYKLFYSIPEEIKLINKESYNELF